MITLYHDWPRVAFITINGAARNARNFLVANNCFTICHQSDPSSYERNVILLPFTRFLGYHFSWSNKTVYATEVTTLRFHTLTVHDLNFVSSPQINSTITSLGITKFNMQFKISKTLICYKVGTWFRLFKLPASTIH